jgi:prepilin-type N-terminal cleavage/methylation domain-containing protein
MARRSGMTLVEIVVVVMILGIIATIALPKVISAIGTAKDQTIQHSIAVVCDAINYYATMNPGKLPGGGGTEDAFKNDLKPYMNKFPVNPWRNSDSIWVVSAGVPLVPVGGTYGWVYDNQSGEFIANADLPAGTDATAIAGP